MGLGTRTLLIDPSVETLLDALVDRRDAADPALVEALVEALTQHPPRLMVEVLSTKRVSAGSGVSYGHTHVTSAETTLALVAIGYGHGIPRKAGNSASVTWADTDGAHRLPIVGRVAMDVLVVDAGQRSVTAGSAVVVFGDPARGEIGLAGWSAAIGEDAVAMLACLDRVRRVSTTPRAAVPSLGTPPS